MATGQLTKIDLLSRILRLKNWLHDGSYGSNCDTKQKEAVDRSLSDIIDILNEYRY